MARKKEAKTDIRRNENAIQFYGENGLRREVKLEAIIGIEEAAQGCYIRMSSGGARLCTASFEDAHAAICPDVDIMEKRFKLPEKK